MMPLWRSLCLAAKSPSTLYQSSKSALHFMAVNSPAIRTQNSLVSPVHWLSPRNEPSLVQSCGMKTKAMLRRRCKDCYFVMRDNRLFVMCKTHPRHKQAQIVKKEKNTWILSHATMSKVRPW